MSYAAHKVTEQCAQNETGQTTLLKIKLFASESQPQYCQRSTTATVLLNARTRVVHLSHGATTLVSSATMLLAPC